MKHLIKYKLFESDITEFSSYIELSTIEQHINDICEELKDYDFGTKLEVRDISSSSVPSGFIDNLFNYLMNDKKDQNANIFLQITYNPVNRPRVFYFEEVSDQVKHIDNYLNELGYELTSIVFHKSNFYKGYANSLEEMDGEKMSQSMIIAWKKL